MAKQRNYKYVITLDRPMWPRKIADDLSYTPGLFNHLVSVTDLQNDDHIYGDSYSVQDDQAEALTPARSRVDGDAVTGSKPTDDSHQRIRR